MDLSVRQAMTARVVTVDQHAAIDDVFDLLLKNAISGLPVVDERNRLVAIVSEADLLRLLYAPAHGGEKLSDVWTAKVYTVHPDDSLPDVVDLFLSHPIRRVPVVDDEGVLVGVVSRRDVIRQIREIRRRVAREREDKLARSTAGD